MTNERKTTIMLVDDHAVVRAGYKRYIELDPQLVVVAEASTGEEAYGLLEKQDADVVIMDLSMPGQGGFETLRRMLNRYPSQKVLIFSMHENASIANQALRLGACGYLTKNMAPDQIIAAIHDAMRGAKPVAPDLQLALNELNSPNLPHNELLPREFEVLVLLASGESIDSISARLHLSTKTASNYQANIRKKLGVSSALELQRYAKEHGLIA
jgi:DNA-binding NarL/FixJ family response regulator